MSGRKRTDASGRGRRTRRCRRVRRGAAPSRAGPRAAGRAGATGRMPAAGARRGPGRRAAATGSSRPGSRPSPASNRPASPACPIPSRPSMRQPGVVPDVRMGQEDPVEWPPLRRAAPKGGLGDEVQLPRDVGGRVHQVEALRGRLHQRERRHVASAAGGHQRAARVAAGGVTADLRKAGVLHRPEHQRVRDPRPCGRAPSAAPSAVGSAAVAARAERNWRRRIRGT